MKPIEPSDFARFFEHGEVSFMERDFPRRQARLEVVLPCCLFQAITPSLLGAGFIDNLQIRQPVAVWMPQLTKSRLNALTMEVPDAAERMNKAVLERIDLILKTYEGLAHFVNDPTDIVPMLPLGTYIKFHFRCRIDDIMKVLEGVQNTPVAGVPEFQWALASVLHCVLQDIHAWEMAKSQANT